MSLSESDVKQIFQRAFSAATANEVALSLEWYAEQNREVVCGTTNVIRFSNSYIRDFTHVRPYYPLTIRVAFGKGEATAITHQLDAASIRDAVGRAEKIAKAAKPIANRQPFPGARNYPAIAAFDSATAAMTADARYEKVAGVLARLQREKLSGSGYFHVDDTLEAHATSAGLSFYRRATKTGYTVTVRSDGTTGRESSRIGSGWAGIGSMYRAGDVDVEALTGIAIDKAARSVNPQPFEMGRPFTVIMEPVVASGFVQALLRTVAGGALTVDGWGSPGKVGETIASDKLTVRSKPDHALIMDSPYGHGGHPAREVVWIEKGIVRAVPGGEAGPAESLVVDGGTKSIEELVSEVDRGILMTQGGASLRDITPGHVNGITKNGLFLIEKGKISKPLKNAWYSVRLQDIVNAIEDVSRPYKTALFGAEGLRGNVMPALRVANFRFDRPSDAV